MLQDLDGKPSTGTKSEQELRGNRVPVTRGQISERQGMPTAQLRGPAGACSQ